MPHDPDPPPEKYDDGTWHQSLPQEPTRASTQPPNLSAPAPNPTAHQPAATILASGTSDTPTGDSDVADGRAHDDSREWRIQPAPLIEKGTVIFAKYQLIEKLGEGGMGQVWRVRNIDMEHESALKLLNPDIARNDRGWRRFRREAQLMRKLNHPNAVTVYEFKRTQSMGYIEMEYVRGRTLENILEERKGQPMPLDEIVPVIDQLCSVLQEAHGHVDENTNKPKPIIHRDLKPSNLMLVNRKATGQNLKVLDFGIAKMIDEEESQDQKLTNQGEFLGTVYYCSPEQIQEGARSDKANVREIDGRSDIYSTGILLYQLLTGQLPFRGGKMAILAAHLTEVPRPLNKANPKAKVPPEIEQLVLQCLAKDPARRPQTARELANRFRAAADRARPRWPGILLKTLAASAVIILIIGATMYGRSRFRNAPTDPLAGTSGPRDVPSPPTADPDKKPPTPPTVLWEPVGYEAVDHTKVVSGLRNEPERLRRKSDGVVFSRYKDGVYLPIGYEPEDPGDVEGEFPRVLVRTSDKKALSDRPEEWVRFIRIKGKTYKCGDPREGTAYTDSEPIWVKVADVYIQETEVTNRVIEEYLLSFPEDAPRLKEWREAATLIKKSDLKKGADDYAANGISYPMARKLARFLEGRLPTESEWEYIAKSKQDDARWAWGNEVPKGGKAKAHLFSLSIPHPKPVKKFAEDKTEQDVFGMTGNVREWCLDAYKPRKDLIPKDNRPDNPLEDLPGSVAPVDLAGIDSQQAFVVRGGSFLTPLDEAFVFARKKLTAADDEDLVDVGVRAVIECPAAPQSK